MNIPEYHFSSYLNKKLFELGLKKSKFVEIQNKSLDEIVIDQDSFIQNVSGKTITIKKGYSLITKDLNKVSIRGEANTNLFILGIIKGNIDTCGTIELALKSKIVGNIKCSKLRVQNNKKDQSINPSIDGNLSMEKSS